MSWQPPGGQPSGYGGPPGGSGGYGAPPGGPGGYGGPPGGGPPGGGPGGYGGGPPGGPGGYGGPPGGGPPGYQPYGPPPGGYGQPWGPAPGLLYAGFWRRFLGYIVDGILVALVPEIIVVEVTAGSVVSAWWNQVQIAAQNNTTAPTLNLPESTYVTLVVVGALIGILYWGVAVAAFGRTIGQAVARVRVVAEEAPTQHLPLDRALTRAAVWWAPPLLGLLPVLGDLGAFLALLAFVWVAWDPRKQGLHDKLGRALVVRPAPAFGLYPFGAPSSPYPPPGSAPPGLPPAPWGR